MGRFSIEPPRLPLAPRPCRGCGGPIYWVTTEHGRHTPLDRYIDHGTSEDGRYVRVDADDTHWATCPMRHQFQRREGA